MVGTAPASAAGTAARRLRRELENLRRSQVPQIAVQPSEDNLLEWHFVLHSFDAETPYHHGRYHGKILFPPQYPLEPPAILMLTPSGRLETGKRLCLSMTDFHPESWNPAWSVETILVGLLSFFVSDKETGYGAVIASDARRRQYAAESSAANFRNAEYKRLFPEFAPEPGSEQAAETATAAVEAEDVEAGAGVEDAVAPAGTVAPPDAPREQAVEGAAVGAAAEQDYSSDEEPTECWICRDTTDEPLIRPCACRGSMSGVHASCVEDWIRHHRRNLLNDEAPRCSVCHEYYRGMEQQPGLGEFIRLKCYQGARLLLRTLVLVFLVCGYQAAATGKALGLRPPVRIALITIFAVAAAHKLVLLTISLPLHRPPPRSPAAQRFFVGNPTRLSKHIAEAFATVLILGFGCLTGTMPWPYFAPVGVAALVPVARVCFPHGPSRACFWSWLQVPVARVCFRHGPSRACFCSWVQVFVFVLCAPFVCIGYPVFWSLRNPRTALKRFWRSVNPLGPGPQIYISMAAIVLCLVCESNVAPVVLWAVHSGLVVLGLLELFLVQKLPWQRSRTCAVIWLLSLQTAALAAYWANALCVFSRGWGAPNKTLFVVHTASCVWLLLVSALTVKINWAFIVEHYRVWQRRHGRFTLQVPSAGRASQRNVAAADGPPV